MFRRLNERETESERQLGNWGFVLRGEPHIAYGIWDGEGGRTIYLYDDGHWMLFDEAHDGPGPFKEGRGTTSLRAYLDPYFGRLARGE